MRQAYQTVTLSCLLAVGGCVTLGSAAESADSVKAQIVALEQSRCQAITNGNVDTLAAMLADDYVHVHGTGKVDTKAGFLSNIQQHPRRTERGALTVRLYGDIAVVTGDQINYPQTGSAPAVLASVTQVLRRISGHWRYESFQLTPRTDEAQKVVATNAAPASAPAERASYFSNTNSQSIWTDLEARQVINKRVLEGGSYSINVRIVKPSDAPLVHAKSADVWIVTAGSATAVTGGELVDSKQRGQTDDFAGSSIRDGTEQLLAPGDIVFVPPGVPHGFKDLHSFRAFLIRFDTK
jgi:mannose-6-phosphate isomerase-like protein (cupin superfamily)